MNAKKLFAIGVLINFLIGFVFGMICIGCTYQRPLLSIRKSSKVIIDSISHHESKVKVYRYISLSGRSINIAVYVKGIEFDSIKNKIKVGRLKKTPLEQMNDGYSDMHSKVVYYDSSGRIVRISKRIHQNRGLTSRTKVYKTIYFENGKRIKSVNE
ncbi:MAG TPA: hypothetical protein VK796_00030 [Cytophaga sp.]|nr:hypothetical protein [Cytophaga sp.]